MGEVNIRYKFITPRKEKYKPAIQFFIGFKMLLLALNHSEDNIIVNNRLILLEYRYQIVEFQQQIIEQNKDYRVQIIKIMNLIREYK
ncbi:hypothetical protein D3C73_1434660 [compost metagenome]